ncbi:MAG: DUF131 domain-containing protein [Methanosarcinales archaeon]|jgi:uncharacterized protein (TIGR00304 family)|nr:DUF131 domain-containing protein [Methanosarcinales archaeon]
MADFNVYFFWPGLIISIILSILLTIGLNLWARRRPQSENHFNERDFDDSSDSNDETRTKTSGMIMIGPIPIAFGNGGFRFDKNAFKYALAFFLIVLIVWYFIFRF